MPDLPGPARRRRPLPALPGGARLRPPHRGRERSAGGGGPPSARRRRPRRSPPPHPPRERVANGVRSRLDTFGARRRSGIGRRAWRSRSDRRGVALTMGSAHPGIAERCWRVPGRVSQARRPQDRWRRPNSRRPLSPPLPFDGQPDLTCDAWPEIGHESLHPGTGSCAFRSSRGSRVATSRILHDQLIGAGFS